MAGGELVAMVEHRSNCRRLARSGGADDEDQPAPLYHEILQDFGQVQRIELRDVMRDEADHRRDRAALQKRREAEAADALHRQADVEFARVLEFAEMRIGQPLGEQGDDRLRRQALLVDRHADTVDLDRNRRAHGQEQIRRRFLGHQAEQALERHGRGRHGEPRTAESHSIRPRPGYCESVRSDEKRREPGLSWRDQRRKPTAPRAARFPSRLQLPRGCELGRDATRASPRPWHSAAPRGRLRSAATR